jgi:hypothetical protein
MKNILMLAGMIFLFCSSPAISQNDYYVKIVEHRDAYYDGGETTAPQDVTIEMWIGDKRFAYISAARNFLFNFEKDSLTVINKTQKAYFTIPLPMNLKKYLDSVQMLRMNKVMGTVKDTKEEKIINNKKCRAFELENYIVRDETHLYDAVNKAWVTKDVPFNLDVYYKSIYNINRFTNFEDSYLSDVDKIKGFTFRTEMVIFQRGDKMTRQRDAVEIIKKTPGNEVYSIPEGFTKKEKITLAEISGR